MEVPFVDLKTQFANLREELLPAMESVMRRSAFILGEEVGLFEKEFAAFCGGKECVGVASGCDALLLALKALGIGPGDEVIAPANTYIATILAISAAGATPVLVDCDEKTYEMDVAAAARAITKKTRALMPVHLYGHPADMDAVMSLARAHKLFVVEDAAQAHGTKYKGRNCGTIGDIGCFSFYPGKNLGAYGDGGAIVTADPEIARKVRWLGNYGQSVKYHHEIMGWNSRLDTVQAAVLRVKLPRLEAANLARAAHAARYCQGLAGLPVTQPMVAQGCSHIYHLFVVRCRNRDGLIDFLKERKVYCGIHYPIPVHLQKAYAHLDYKEGAFPVSETAAREIVSLPMFPELTDAQIDFVCQGVREFLAR